MYKILNTLRTSTPPQSSVTLVTDLPSPATSTPAIPRAALPLSPIQYLTSIVDSVSPLVRTRQSAGLAGGGQMLPIPIPLRVTQRRRAAIKWILDLAENNKDDKLADRVAKELVKVAMGTSSVWNKRSEMHRLAMTSRANVSKRKISRGRHMAKV
jgi:small subunit ribosomal protein S7